MLKFSFVVDLVELTEDKLVSKEFIYVLKVSSVSSKFSAEHWVELPTGRWWFVVLIFRGLSNWFVQRVVRNLDKSTGVNIDTLQL